MASRRYSSTSSFVGDRNGLVKRVERTVIRRMGSLVVFSPIRTAPQMAMGASVGLNHEKRSHEADTFV